MFIHHNVKCMGHLSYISLMHHSVCFIKQTGRWHPHLTNGIREIVDRGDYDAYFW